MLLCPTCAAGGVWQHNGPADLMIIITSLLSRTRSAYGIGLQIQDEHRSVKSSEVRWVVGGGDYLGHVIQYVLMISVACDSM
jgi:hypothetical protein